MDREEAIKEFEEIKRNAETHLGKKYAIGCENYYKNKIELAEIALDALRLNENQTRSSDDILYADHTGYAADMMTNADLLARAEAAEARAEKAEEIASDLCDDFTDFVTGGVPNAAPYCFNCRPECVDGRGWCNVENRVCKGFLPKAAGVKEE